MQKEINDLKEKFYKIRKMGLCKSLRSGTTGLGFTFETLIGKEENNSYEPDFNGIEIKVKLGYTKTPTTLFCLTPKGHDYTVKYLLETFGYPDKENKNIKCFRASAYYRKNHISVNKYILKLKINREKERLELVILDINLNILDNTICWTFNELEKRLTTKLNYLAYIKGYPYKKDNQVYYKYTNMNIYRLKDFNNFLELIEADKIHVVFNVGIGKKGKNIGKIEDRGTAFKIYNDCIDQLFDLVE